ncbi:MAG: phosphatase PAP2 family protein [Bacteroidales bacterium]|nr:phosphatase PAP2 family protein [Bacteroidales bacterium]
MLDAIVEFDKGLMLSINGCTNALLDFLMPLISHKYTGIPIYAGILALIIYQWRKSPKTIIIMVAAVLLTFALCDSLSVALFKQTVQRLRPAWDPEIGHLVRMLEYKGGQFGFVSSHASNLFGLATVTSLIVKKRWYTIFIYLWAAAVGYSRVYVGKHFPLDVICGALFGMLVGYLVFKLLVQLFRKMKLTPWGKDLCANGNIKE